MIIGGFITMAMLTDQSPWIVTAMLILYSEAFLFEDGDFNRRFRFSGREGSGSRDGNA